MQSWLVSAWLGLSSLRWCNDYPASRPKQSSMDEINTYSAMGDWRIFVKSPRTMNKTLREKEATRVSLIPLCLRHVSLNKQGNLNVLFWSFSYQPWEVLDPEVDQSVTRVTNCLQSITATGLVLFVTDACKMEKILTGFISQTASTAVIYILLSLSSRPT